MLEAWQVLSSYWYGGKFVFFSAGREKEDEAFVYFILISIKSNKPSIIHLKRKSCGLGLIVWSVSVNNKKDMLVKVAF